MSKKVLPFRDVFDSFQVLQPTSNERLQNFVSSKDKNKQTDLKEQDAINSLMSELNHLIGLNNVKSLVNEILAFADIQQERRDQGLNAMPLVLHMIFKGNPGTGKTTIARLLGKILKLKGYLSSGHIIEVERADLVGEYIGHTAQKVRDQIKKGMGGILFIDEAYSLARGGEKDFGKEAIDALVKGMEDYKNDIILILAGYKEEMENFLQINPGLMSRFPIHIEFNDYTLEELVEIAELMVSEREYILAKSSKAKLYNILALQRSRGGLHSGNARLVRNLIERGIRKQAVRLKNKKYYSRDELMTLMKDDFTDNDLTP